MAVNNLPGVTITTHSFQSTGKQRTWTDVLQQDLDPLVPVRATLLVEEAEHVQHLVHGRAFLGARTHQGQFLGAARRLAHHGVAPAADEKQAPADLSTT